MYRNLILTSCGISILTNLAKKFNFKENIYYLSNYTEDEFPKDKIEKFGDFLDNSRKYLLNADKGELCKISAELNALINFYGNHIKNFPKTDYHIILHTDTYLGKSVAEILRELFSKYNISVELLTKRDLKTSSFEEFQIALSELAEDLSERLINYKNSGYRIIFNLTGGFKSINSFLQTMASIYADESIYIFETSNNLLKIPRLPLDIDYSIFKENINIFRMLELGIYNNLLKEKIKNIPEITYLEINEEYSLSPWGELIWKKAKEEIYKNKLVEPILDRIVISKNLKKQFENFSEKEKVQINKNIDKLERCIFNNRQNCETSLGFKEVEGKEAEKYQYEMYCFDGNDSRRLYIKYEDDKYILYEINDHL
ncbi:MAG: hypothetical protein DSY59_05020 [Persephonella sp.]|nr:MAG: hypothetical protein DSY59_05020 [Persephonella sp.]